jgi:hypothetical protein
MPARLSSFRLLAMAAPHGMLVGGAAGKAAHLVGCESPRRQLPDSDGEHIRGAGRSQTARCSDVEATAAQWINRPIAVGATWVASKPGGFKLRGCTINQSMQRSFTA